MYWEWHKTLKFRNRERVAENEEKNEMKVIHIMWRHKVVLEFMRFSIFTSELQYTSGIEFCLRIHWSVFLINKILSLIICLDNGLATTRRQAIIRNIDGIVCWRKYVSRPQRVNACKSLILTTATQINCTPWLAMLSAMDVVYYRYYSHLNKRFWFESLTS